MFEGGFFIGSRGGNGSSGSSHEDVYLDNGNVVFSPIDPIHVDENGDVFYSQENKNSYMYSDVDGKIFVKAVI